MRFFKVSLLFISVLTLTNCASGYKMIAPESINYISISESDNIKMEYKYDLLDKKYAKKEVKKGVKIVAVKITNNSDSDITFGSDAKLVYENGSEIYVMDNEQAFKTVKQSPATYLFYLLLTPVNLFTATTNSNGVQ